MIAFPKWIVPVEMVRGLATPQGTAQLLSLTLRSCTYAPHAIVEGRGAGFVAVVTYDDPHYPGTPITTAVALACPAQENQHGAPR